jgi:hypothetical protein
MKQNRREPFWLDLFRHDFVARSVSNAHLPKVNSASRPSRRLAPTKNLGAMKSCPDRSGRGFVSRLTLIYPELLKSHPENSVPDVKLETGIDDCLSTQVSSFQYGGAREDRTPDLLRARQALSQLSYGPS